MTMMAAVDSSMAHIQVTSVRVMLVQTMEGGMKETMDGVTYGKSCAAAEHLHRYKAATQCIDG